MTIPKIICSSDIPFNLDCLYSFLSSRSELIVHGKFNLKELPLHNPPNECDILVLDICEQSDSDIVNHVFQAYIEKTIMVLSRSDNHYFLSSLLHLGAKGCFVKSESAEEFVSALLDLHKNNAFLPTKLFNKLFCELPVEFKNRSHRFVNNNKHQEVPILAINSLTPRELEILKLIINGESSHTIAEELFISEFTVSTHRKHILKKLGVTNTTTLIRCALEQGFI